MSNGGAGYATKGEVGPHGFSRTGPNSLPSPERKAPPTRGRSQRAHLAVFLAITDAVLALKACCRGDGLGLRSTAP